MNINVTLFGQLITFIVFVWITMKYVWTPIMGALDERRKRIADGLAAAERGQHEQDLAKDRVKTVLKDAKIQASDIVAQGQKRASEIVDEAKSGARIEGDRLITAARAEIDQERNRVREQLREKIAELAMIGAEKILKKEIDTAAHKDIVDKLAEEI